MLVYVYYSLFFGKNWPSNLDLMPYGAETNPNIAKTEQGENPFKKALLSYLIVPNILAFGSFLQLFLYVVSHLTDWFLNTLSHSARIIMLGLKSHHPTLQQSAFSTLWDLLALGG